MGEESDGDADLPEGDPESGSPGEVDEPPADPEAGSDEPSDGSDFGEPSPSDDLVENGGTPSPTEPSAADSDDGTDEQSDEAVDETGDDEAGDDETDEADEADEASDDEEGEDGEQGEDEAEDADDGSGNLQPVEPPEVSLSPDDLTSDEEPVVTNRERPEPSADGPDGSQESTARPEVHQPPEGAEPPEPPEPEAPGEGMAPLAGDVATTPDSIEGAERSEPFEDEEMPLADHIEEMIKRLAVVLVLAGVVSLAVLPFAETAINFLWNSVLPAGETTRPRLYGPLALVLTKLKVASLAGLVVALPVFVYETYLFMRPGLYPHERRYYLAAVPTSLVLAFVGISFAYFLILPVIFEYFLYYSEDVTTIAFALTKTFDLILLLMGYLAIVFQIPLFIMLAIMMGLTTRLWLVERRLYFWGAFLGIAFLFSPDPTGMAPIMVAATMVGLFEGTLFLLKWTGR